MDIKSLKELKQIILNLAYKINAPKDLIPSFGKTNDFAHPHIESNLNGVFHYIIVERGEELERETFSKIDDLLFKVFKDITFTMAAKYELEHRKQDQDFRILLFEEQEKLLARLKKEWAEKEKERHERLLDEF
jgi:hypothetical protein